MAVRAGRLAAAAAAVFALSAGPAAAHHGEGGLHPDPRPVWHGGALAAPARPAAEAPKVRTRGPERALRRNLGRGNAPRR